MDTDYDPNNPPGDVIITMVEPATVEMIASQVEGPPKKQTRRLIKRRCNNERMR
jgi:hypothetical protein